MWPAHDVYATNNKPAINGENIYFIIPPLEATRLDDPPSSASAQQTRPRNQTQQGTQRNHFVMNVTSPQTTSDPDPFTMNYFHWPLEYFDEVYMVSATFSTSDPLFWSPLLTASARAKALRSYSEQCLNRSGRP